jgi:hypothetical protein
VQRRFANSAAKGIRILSKRTFLSSTRKHIQMDKEITRPFRYEIAEGYYGFNLPEESEIDHAKVDEEVKQWLEFFRKLPKNG